MATAGQALIYKPLAPNLSARSPLGNLFGLEPFRASPYALGRILAGLAATVPGRDVFIACSTINLSTTGSRQGRSVRIAERLRIGRGRSPRQLTFSGRVSRRTTSVVAVYTFGGVLDSDVHSRSSGRSLM